MDIIRNRLFQVLDEVDLLYREFRVGCVAGGDLFQQGSTPLLLPAQLPLEGGDSVLFDMIPRVELGDPIFGLSEGSRECCGGSRLLLEFGSADLIREQTRGE